MQPPTPLLALADEVPNYDAIALSPGVGWLFLAALVCLSLFFLAHRESWRRLFLRVDDPRPMAAMRIVFGVCALCNVNGLWELFDYLFTDEGLFSTDVAQRYRARSQFLGFGDGTADTEPWGFFSFGAFLEWLKGPNYSLLLFDSSPRFFWAYLAVFEVAMVAFIVGFQTKWIKWVAWFLYMGIILRNTIFWEATENVYRVFFFYLILSRCGHAWSVDNWLRCRRLRKEGRLSEHGKPGAGAGAWLPATPEEGAGRDKSVFYEPIFRPIPAWPRLLVMLNIATLYCATGVLKNGPVWNRGDAFYYAFNLDHFYRLPPQKLSALFGTTLFRLNTWVVHWWESLFPLIILGLILRWHQREKIPRLTGWRLWTARLGLGGFVAWFYAIILYSYPVHYATPKGGLRLFGRVLTTEEAIPLIQGIVGVAVPLIAALVVLGYRWLRDRQDVPRSQRKRLKWLDLDWVCRWLFGRRLWLVLGMIFHGHLILTMNIGWFSPGLLACYVAFLNGEEISFITTRIGQTLHKLFKLPVKANVREGRPIPGADTSLPPGLLGTHRDGVQLSWPVLFTGLGLIVVGILRRVQTDEDMWVRIQRIVERAKVDFPEGLADHARVIEVNWFVGMVVVMALVAIIRRRRGFEFNPYFGPVIVLAGWAGSLAPEHDFGMKWSLVVVGALTLLACRKKAPVPPPIPEVDPDTGRPRKPWAYGPIGRTISTIFVLYHIAAVASQQLPDKDSWSTFHRDVDLTFRTWLQTTQTTQGWGMFAPNPPRRNVHLRVMVVDQEGEVYDLNTDVYACFLPDASKEVCDAVYPLPWIWYTRQRKMNRRIAGSEGGHGSWYQKWHARWVCRQWELEHGELPRRVELYKITYPIPSPQQVRGNPYDPKTQYNNKGSHKKIHTTECRGAFSGQLSHEVRERHGLPPVDDKHVKVWNKHRCKRWEEKLIEDARKADPEVDILDPKFDVCPDKPDEVRKLEYEQGKEDLLLED